METRNKLWLGLGAVCVVGTATWLAIDTDLEPKMDHIMVNSAAEGGEGGEGATETETIFDDSAYLGQLAFIRGHLNVGVDLYRQGELEASATHMKHPEDELYANLLPALEAREAPGFAEQLAALADAVSAGRSEEEVEAAYQELLMAITQAERAVENQDARLIGNIIVNLVRTAAAEYDIAVGDDGRLENEHEYQDALGFVRVANELFDRLPATADNSSALAAIRNQLDLLIPIWPGLRAPERLDTAPSVIYGAASRIEIAVSGL